MYDMEQALASLKVAQFDTEARAGGKRLTVGRAGQHYSIAASRLTSMADTLIIQLASFDLPVAQSEALEELLVGIKHLSWALSQSAESLQVQKAGA